MQKQFEFHYSEDMFHLTDQFLTHHLEFTRQDEKSIYVVNQPTRVQLLRNRWHLNENEAISTAYPFTTFNRFIRDLIEKLSVPLKFLSFVERSLILKQILLETREELQYFSFPEGSIPDDTIRKLLRFFDDARLNLLDKDFIENGSRHLVLSTTDKLQSDLNLLFARYSNFMGKFFMDEAEILKHIMFRASSKFFDTYYPELLAIAFEDISGSRQLHLNFFNWLHEKGKSVFLLTSYGKNPELYGHKQSLFNKIRPMVKHIHGYFETVKISDSLFQIKSPHFSFWERVKIIPAPNRIAEVEQIAAEIKKMVLEEKTDSSRIGITGPQLEVYLPIIETVFRRHNIPFYHQQFIKLSQSPVAGTLELLLRTVMDEFALEGILKILHSPFFRYHEKLSGRSIADKFESLRVKSGKDNILTFIRNEKDILQKKEAEEYHADGETLELLENVLIRFFSDIRFLESPQTAGSIYTSLQKFLKRQWRAVSFNEDTAGSEILRSRSSMNFLNRIIELLNFWKDYMEKANPGYKFSCREFYEVFSSLCRSAYFSGQEGTHGGVQIVSMQELTGYDFSVLFVTGMEENVFPTRSSAFFTHPSNLPAQLQSLLPADQLLQDRELFFQLLQNPAELLRFSYSRYHQEQPILRSIFLRELQRISEEPLDEEALPPLPSHAELIGYLAEQFPPAKLDYHNLPEKWKALFAETELKHYHFKRSVIQRREEGVVTGLWEGDLSANAVLQEWFQSAFSTVCFSPTQLETFAACPHIFFQERIIGIKPAEELEEYLSPRERGSLVHAVLFRFFHENNPQDRKLDRLLSIASEEFESIPLPPGLIRDLQKEFYLGNDFNKGLFHSFWDYEMEQENLYPTKPTRFELSFGQGIISPERVDHLSTVNPFTYKHEDEIFYFRGKIDRVETAADGTVLVVDYKTGQFPALREMWEGLRLQLPIYLKAAGEILKNEKIKIRPGGGAFYSLKKENDIEKKIVFADKDSVLQPPLVTESARFPGNKYSIDNKPASLEDFLERIMQFAVKYIRDIKSGRFVHTTDKKQCVGWNGRLCDYLPVCRVNQAKQDRIRRENNFSTRHS
ncbi:MAG: PD-(D/E)XK nuclease family protein [Calditrichaeota bacterium]|nr:PD-(D/E)XK nuclease family protein [Calditrichota bacterium]RQW06394.1 MAG: PD-(D/E)XK nuclease family protein [Calditrichota bacterium]